ncbi:hypothetical protein YC2023_053916 [Brassica napus]
MFGLQRKSSKEKSPRQTVSQFPFKYSLNNFDEFVSVQEQLDIRCKDHIKTTRDVADPKRRLLQFDVQGICDNFEKGMMKALKYIRKSHKKSTSARAPIAEPSLIISEKPKCKSETHVEEFKDFSDSLPIFDESDEEPIESLFSCEKNCDLPSLESEFMNDNEQTIVELTVLQPEHPSSLVLSQQVFEEEPLDYPHQGPRLDTRNPLVENLGPIFDEEDEHVPVFDEEATSITSIVMESHLCFDPSTTHAPLSPDLQEHCEKSDLINYLPNMFVKISSHDFLKHSKGFDHFEKSPELDLKQTDFCARKSFDSFVFKENSFNLSCYRYALITGNLFASTCALDEFLVKKLLEQKSLRAKTDFCCDSVLKSDLELLYSNSDHVRLILKMSYDISCLESILIYNTFFDKSTDPWISNSRFEIDLLCSKSKKHAHVLNFFFRNCAITCPDTILVYNTYFDRLHDDLNRVLHVLEKETLVSNLNKYLSCTYDPGKMDLRANHFQEGGNDAPLGSAPSKTEMHGLIMETVIFSSREFRPPEKLEMDNLLSDEPKTNSIMPKVIIHVLDIEESLGLDGFQKDSKTDLFGPYGETDKILAKGKDGFRPGLKGTCLGPYLEHILHFSKSWSWLYQEAGVSSEFPNDLRVLIQPPGPKYNLGVESNLRVQKHLRVQKKPPGSKRPPGLEEPPGSQMTSGFKTTSGSRATSGFKMISGSRANSGFKTTSGSEGTSGFPNDLRSLYDLRVLNTTSRSKATSGFKTTSGYKKDHWVQNDLRVKRNLRSNLRVQNDLRVINTTSGSEGTSGFQNDIRVLTQPPGSKYDLRI